MKFPFQLVPFHGNPKTTFRHRNVISSTVDIGVKIERKFFDGFRSIKGYEVVYDNYEYFVSVVVYPKKEKIVSFDKIFARINEVYSGLVLPVFVLVDHGVCDNWFAIYFRKNISNAK